MYYKTVFVVAGRDKYRTVYFKDEDEILMQDYGSQHEAEDVAATLAWATNSDCYFVSDPKGQWADIRIRQLEEKYDR